MTDSLTELELEVDAARARLDRTVGEIQSRLTVAGLVDELAGSIGKAQVSAGFDGALGIARRNPLPLMIAAAGIGWFLHRMGRQRIAARLSSTRADAELPLLNTGHARVYDPDASTRHPAQDTLESRRDLTAHA